MSTLNPCSVWAYSSGDRIPHIAQDRQRRGSNQIRVARLLWATSKIGVGDLAGMSCHVLNVRCAPNLSPWDDYLQACGRGLELRSISMRISQNCLTFKS